MNDSVNNLAKSLFANKIVRLYCDEICVPSIFDSLETDDKGKCIGSFGKGFKVNQKYIDGKKKSDEMFNEIMSSPEKINKTVKLYCGEEI